MELENEKLIREFLFGELPEQERFEFEEKFIEDADLFEQIKIVEDELIENYIRGWMNPAEHSKFEQNFLTTEKRREHVWFSRLLIDKIQNSETAVAEKTVEKIPEDSIWQKLAGLFLTPKVAMATAFALLIAVFGSWFLYQNLNNQKPELAQKTVTKSTETPKPTQPPEIPGNVAADETDNEQTESDEDDADNSLIKEIPKQSPKVIERIVQKTPTPKSTPKVKTSAPNPVFALFAGTLRSGGKNNVLNLPINAKGATLQLNLETVDYRIYQARLTDADGNVIFRKDNLKTEKSKINLFVSAENLSKGDYMIKLYGKNDLGEYESVADFQFRVK